MKGVGEVILTEFTHREKDWKYWLYFVLCIIILQWLLILFFDLLSTYSQQSTTLMGSIRKQTIISSIILYVGFAVGAFNVYLYSLKGGAFTEAQFGLTRLFFEFGQNIYAFGTIGSLAVLFKFHSLYKRNLPDHDNDLLTWVVVVTTLGFSLTFLIGVVFKPVMIKLYIDRSALFIDYYYWVFLFGAGMTYFLLLEAYCQVLKQANVSSFLKETGLRILTTLLIVLYLFHVVNFFVFITIFSGLYLFITFILMFYLVKKGQFHFVFSFSRVTKRFWKKLLSVHFFMLGATFIGALGATISGILIGGMIGLGNTGIFTFAEYLSNFVQVPQRSLQNVSMGAIIQAWGKKDFVEIERIYARSSINMLIMSLFIYGNVVLNAAAGINLLGIKGSYLSGMGVMMILGLSRIIDAGTGVNNQVILTSPRWRFDLYSGIILVILIIPANYFFIKQFGIIGSAYAQLLSMTIYNAIRWEFIRRNFNMQPFTVHTLFAILLAIISFVCAYFLGQYVEGWIAFIVRAIVFSFLMIMGTIYFKITPDSVQLIENMKKRLS